MIMECLRSLVSIYVIKEEVMWTNATNYVNVSSNFLNIFLKIKVFIALVFFNYLAVASLKLNRICGNHFVIPLQKQVELSKMYSTVRFKPELAFDQELLIKYNIVSLYPSPQLHYF